MKLSMARMTLSSFTPCRPLRRPGPGRVPPRLAPTAQAQEAPPTVPSVPTLGPGAGIRLVVVGASDLTGDYTVDPDGNITLLYIGAVHVGGLTAPQVAERLASKDELGKYYRRPQVLATQTSMGGLAVEVTGAVTNQGARTVRTDARLNDLLQPAGPAGDADLARVRVTHGLPDAPHVTETVDYQSFLNTASAAGNPALADGDVVFVPRKGDVPIGGDSARRDGETGPSAAPCRRHRLRRHSGVGRSAGGRRPRRHRPAPGRRVQDTPIDYDAALRRQNDPAANPALRDGDALLVGAATIVNTYMISGRGP